MISLSPGSLGPAIEVDHERFDGIPANIRSQSSQPPICFSVFAFGCAQPERIVPQNATDNNRRYFFISNPFCKLKIRTVRRANKLIMTYCLFFLTKRRGEVFLLALKHLLLIREYILPIQTGPYLLLGLHHFIFSTDDIFRLWQHHGRRRFKEVDT